MKQHSVPQCYLKAWCDPDVPEGQVPYVWLFGPDGASSKRKAPRNIFVETDMYTVRRVDGSRDLTLEKGLSQLESDFAYMRRTKLEYDQELDVMERIKLCAFVAAMEARTKPMRDHWRENWKEMQQQMEDLNEWAKTATPGQLTAASLGSGLDDGRTLGPDDVDRLVREPIQHMLHSVLQTVTPILCRFDLAVLKVSDDVGFITSDHPCIWVDPEASKRPFPYNHLGLAYKSLLIVLPLSPRRCLFLNRMGIAGRHEVPLGVADSLNSLVCAHAGEHIVVRRRVFKAAWSRPTETPELQQ